jgi:hypothetical protein
MRFAAIVAVGWIAVAGCGGEIDLAVDVRTDYTPGRDFVGVRAEVFRGSDPRTSDAPPHGENEVTAPSTADFYLGRRVADFGGIEAGRWWVKVVLLRLDGSVLATRLASVEVGDTRIVTVVFTRTCADVSCPGSADLETDTECLGGRCVDPTCGADADATACAAECNQDIGCVDVPHAECAVPTCREGVCLLRAEDARCGGGGARCDPGDGCFVPVREDAGPTGMDGGPPTDSGPDTGMMPDTGPPDAGPPDASCECLPDAVESTTQACGRCGSQPISRSCGADCRWGPWGVIGACSGEGGCTPGAIDGYAQACGFCNNGSQSCNRTCDASCNWGGYLCGACTGEVFCSGLDGPVCETGMGRTPMGCPPGMSQICTCTRGAWTSCMGTCYS